jgi:hypothetical protein
MNKLILQFLIIVSTGLLISCEDELSQTSTTSKDLSTFLRNEAEVEEYVNAVYASLQVDGLYGLYLPALGEIPSDNSFDEVPSNDGGQYGQLDEFSVIAANPVTTATWREAYKGIQRANVVLSRIGAVTFKDEGTKSYRVGEMKFIRALLYFNLVQLYGDVPLAAEETTDPNSYFGQGRNPASSVYDQIKKDLTDAIGVLPVVAGAPGRVIKTAAQSLLAKVYLTLGDYANARTQLEAVVTSQKHGLVDRPADVFSIANENNKEIIFAVQFASGINGNTEGSTMFQQFSPSGTQSGAKGHNLPTKGLYNLYSASDLRKGVYVDLTAAGVPYNKKLTKPTTVITDGGSDVVVLRYADVLLMLAEVENALHNTTVAAGYLNKVRVRAALPETTASTEADLRAAIDLERRLELAGEGHRWFDLLRTDKAIDVMNQWFKDNGKLITIDEHNLVMPVPQTQRDTDPTISQNTGYN